MSKKNHRGQGREFMNSLSELVTMVKLANTSPLSGYGTISYSTSQTLITLNHVLIAYLFAGNGIFQAAIQAPVQDALSKGVTIKSDELDDDDINAIIDFMDEKRLWDPITNYEYWRLCFGGAGLIINTGQDPSTPFRRLRQGEPFELYDADRWQLTQTAATQNGLGFYEQDPDELEFFNLNAVQIHRSRVLIGKGRRAPWMIRQQLQGWGMSEAERMVRDLNNYLKTQNVLYEILDETKIDIYHIKDLAQGLISGRTQKIFERIQLANQLKNYLNALVLDGEEEYESRTMTFHGLAEVMNENRIGIAAALRRPMTKLFGLSPAGFSNGDADLDSYYQLVESEERAPLKPVVRKVVELTCQHLFGFVPKFQIEFPPLKQLSELDQETIKTQKTERVTRLYESGLLQAQEAVQVLKKEGVIDIETAIERGAVPPEPPPGSPGNPSAPNGGGNQGGKYQNSFERFNWVEGDHSRDEDGKFTSGGSSAIYSEKPQATLEREEKDKKRYETGRKLADAEKRQQAAFETYQKIQEEYVKALGTAKRGENKKIKNDFEPKLKEAEKTWGATTRERNSLYHTLISDLESAWGKTTIENPGGKQFIQDEIKKYMTGELQSSTIKIYRVKKNSERINAVKPRLFKIKQFVNSDFKEEDHKRDSDGKFSSGGGNGSAVEQGEKKYSTLAELKKQHKDLEFEWMMNPSEELTKKVQDARNLYKAQLQKEQEANKSTIEKISNTTGIKDIHITEIPNDVMENISDEFESVFNKFPELKGQFLSFTDLEDNEDAFASCMESLGAVAINKNHFSDIKDLEKKWEKNLKAKHHPQGTNWKSIINHEIGHRLNRILNDKFPSLKKDNLNIETRIRDKALKKLNLTVNDITEELSEAATKAASEFFAEAFSEYTNSKSPRRLATEVGKMIELAMKGELP